MEHAKTVATLNALIDTCKDGEMGFRVCAEHAHSPELKPVFVAMADQCTAAAGELSVLVRHLGGDAEVRGSVAGALHRGWLDLKAKVSSNDDHAILEECERGEDAAKKRYRDALASDLPPNVRVTIDRQYQGLLANHDKVRNLRDRLVAH